MNGFCSFIIVSETLALEELGGFVAKCSIEVTAQAVSFEILRHPPLRMRFRFEGKCDRHPRSQRR